MEASQTDIDLIRRHTNYTSDEIILEKLQEFITPIEVISDYLKKSVSNTKCNIQPIANEKISINQEIYRQMRKRLIIVKK